MAEVEIRGRPVRIWKNCPPTLPAVLDVMRDHGELPFLVYQNERLSYAQHDSRVAALATALIEDFSVKKGDRVALAMRNYPDWVVAFWAAAQIGAVVVPLNAWWTANELEYGLEDSGSAVLIADKERAERMAGHLGGLDLRGLISARGAAQGWTDFDDLLARHQGAPLPQVPIAPEDDATIFYTSGTTGSPKGAVGSQRNIATNIFSLMFCRARAVLRDGGELPDPNQPQPKKATLLAVPFFHVTGCHSAMLSSAYAGNKLVLMHKWDADQALALIERESVTGFGGVPAIAWQVLEHPERRAFDLSSVEYVAYGGAPAAPELVSRIGEVFPAALSANGYGMTETSSLAAQNMGSDYLARPDSIGPLIPVCDGRVVGEGGEDVADGVGELWIRGPNIVRGYWNKPDESAESFVEGWMRTGDLVRRDEDGFLYLLDRAKDMLIRGGENVYCVEVEDALYSHPQVMDAAVIGLPHKILGEEVGALVQVTPQARVTADELKDQVAERLAAFKVPVRIELQTEPLPRNANGKILKSEIRDRMIELS
jgi:long-chain acyl-CoA synthetase